MLSNQIQEKIQRELKKYPADQKQSAVMAALRFVQDEKGWISNDDMTDVADYLGMPHVAVYEVATFYHMYNLKPMGKYTLTVCTNLSCQLMGANETLDYLKQKLGIGLNETTPDGKWGLREAECMGACVEAPLLNVNNKRMCSRLTPAKIDEILAELDK
jgi:NADH-quinone oxidoreductase subunit E